MARKLGSCKKCNEPFMRAALFALMADCGAKLSWDPSECRDGTPHEFGWLEDENTAAVIEDEPGAWDNEMEEFDAEM